MKIVHFADLHLGVDNYGALMPDKGWSTCFESFLKVLDELVDYSIDNGADLVLFCGDAYRTREPNQTQQREFARRISRLIAGEIPVFLLAGNHDLPNAIGRATSVEIFNTLALKNVTVANRPGVHVMSTRSGPVQVLALPWIKRNVLAEYEKDMIPTLEEARVKIEEVLTWAVGKAVLGIDPALPALLAGHVSVSGARAGSERNMMLGYEPVLLGSVLKQAVIDYVALGHVHRKQVLYENSRPALVYSGSLQRVEFGDEDDEKGFYVVEIGQGDRPDSRQVDFQFVPVNARKFLTIGITVPDSAGEPMETVLRTVSNRLAAAEGAIVRVIIEAGEKFESQIREDEIRRLLAGAAYCQVMKNIQREHRTRLGDRSIEELTPIKALEIYLRTRKDLSPEDRDLLLREGARLVRDVQAESDARPG